MSKVMSIYVPLLALAAAVSFPAVAPLFVHVCLPPAISKMHPRCPPYINTHIYY